MHEVSWVGPCWHIYRFTPRSTLPLLYEPYHPKLRERHTHCSSHSELALLIIVNNEQQQQLHPQLNDYIKSE